MIRFSDNSKHIYTYDATGKKLRAEYHTPIMPVEEPQVPDMEEEEQEFAEEEQTEWEYEQEWGEEWEMEEEELIPAEMPDENGEVVEEPMVPEEDNCKPTIFFEDDDIACEVTTIDYCGDFIYVNGKLKRMLFPGGYVTFRNDSIEHPEYHFYLTDHQGNIRVVANQNGEVEQVNHYYPYGGLMGESTSSDHQPYKYNGKELDRHHGLGWMDYGARWYNGYSWTTPDPLAEKYREVSPYMYCLGNPIKYIDPDGKRIGDYLDSNGNLIGTDGNNDGRLYVLKTSKSSFDSYGNAPVAGITRKEAKRIVKEKDISNKDNFVEITGSKAIREAVVSKIADDGTGGTIDKNNREYLITFDKTIQPYETNSIYCKKGPVGNPAKDDEISVSVGNSPYIEYIHTHPSGFRDERRWHQAPSKQDIMNTFTQKYVFGMGDNTVYIYNSNGINATIPLDIYRKYEVTNGK